ncbi:MAG TPA: hypothetical protein VGM19_05960 [Armatimonadota bacterium]|jgi:5-methylcytosine-specific restriction protein A
MNHLLANVAWSSNDWTEPTLEGVNFGWVKSGNNPHEGYNFAFRNRRNRKTVEGRKVIHGYVETTGNLPRDYYVANDGRGICFFHSLDPKRHKRFIVGLYGCCSVFRPDEVDEILPDGSPWNLRAPQDWAVLFLREAQVPYDKQRHVPELKKQVGRNITNIGDTEATAILEDALSEHRRVWGDNREAVLGMKIELLESLLNTVAYPPEDSAVQSAAVRSSADQVSATRREAAESEIPQDVDGGYWEGQTRIVEIRAHMRNPLFASKVKAKAHYTCTVCGFSYDEAYGERGIGFAECHHLEPLASLTAAKLSDERSAVCVCANCHRMLHRGGLLLSPDELREIMKATSSTGT